MRNLHVFKVYERSDDALEGGGVMKMWLLSLAVSIFSHFHISTFNMIAESKPQEKEMMVNLVMTFLA